MTADTPDSWRHLLPPEITTDAPYELTFPVHVPHGVGVEVWVVGEDSREVPLVQVEDNSPPRDVDGVLTGRARFALGALEPGEYTLFARVADGTEDLSELVVRPAEVSLPAEQPASTEAGADTEHEPNDEAQPEGTDGEPLAGRAEYGGRAECGGRAEYGGRAWGVSATLPALRSRTSWGVGDFADLADLAVTVAVAGGDYLLLTPFVRSVADEVTRLGLTPAARGGFIIDPIHIRPEDIREVTYLPSSQRTMLEWGSEEIRVTNESADQIDFDGVWEAKRAALEVVFAAPRSPVRQVAFQRFTQDNSEGLAEYVHAAVAAEREDPHEFFATLSSDTTAGAGARREAAKRIEFYLWLQWVARDQLRWAHAQARLAGMSIGLIHTAPAALDPDILTEILPYAGGVNLIDAAAPGVAAVAAGAREAGLLMFADGREPPRPADLVAAGVTPHTTLWAQFESEPEQVVPVGAMVSVAMTQDPPTAGFLAEEHLGLMDRLGLLTAPYEEVRREERIVRERLLEAARAAGVLEEGATERQQVEGLHRYLAHTPAAFITFTLSDGVGNRRPFALGGDYPDWAYPYTDGAGAAVLVDELGENARFNSLITAIDTELRLSQP